MGKPASNLRMAGMTAARLDELYHRLGEMFDHSRKKFRRLEEEFQAEAYTPFLKQLYTSMQRKRNDAIISTIQMRIKKAQPATLLIKKAKRNPPPSLTATIRCCRHTHLSRPF